jgi:two-component system chemotaxis sensor kinase CheA
MAEILESFFVETKELMETLSQDLLKLEKDPKDSELHNTIFRAVHTVKGTSSFLGFDQVTELAHKFEELLNKVRKKELTVTSAAMDVVLEAYDVLKELLQRLVDKNEEPLDLGPILAKLVATSSGEMVIVSSKAAVVEQPEAKTLKAEQPLPTTTQEKSAEIPYQGSPEGEHEEGEESHESEISFAKVESLDSTAKDVSGPTAGKPKAEQATAKNVDTTIRVDVGRLDALMNLVGELVLGRNRLSQIAYIVNTEFENIPFAKELLDTNSQIDLITTELQMGVMKTRMVPIAKVFNRLPRMVRDLSKDLNKEIEISMAGEETELDKSIIEELNDPLVHIMRNAADHGVEKPEDRIKAGKNPRGQITVKAEHEGNNIVISITDDGKGMDPEKLKKKAIEKGLVTEAQAKEMSKREALNLIFAPGFSMAATVTNVSGRGVGMDVVKTNITKLKGIVDIESEVGKGSAFIIKLPLTLAIIQGLLVQVHNEIFAIPLSSVIEVVRIQIKDVKTMKGKEVIRLRDSVLPLARIADVFQVKGNGVQSDWFYIVVIGIGEQRLGVIVDMMIGQKEVVIKSLGGYLSHVPGIAGSTILGDGRVIMILDVGQFVTLCKGA